MIHGAKGIKARTSSLHQPSKPAAPLVSMIASKKRSIVGGVHTRVGDGQRPASTAAFRQACAWLLPFGFLHHTSAQSFFISSAEKAGGGIPGLMLRDPARRAASPNLLIDRFHSMILLVVSRSSSSVVAQSRAAKAALWQEGVRLTHLTTLSCTNACQ